MRILVYEPQSSGHFYIYLQHLIPALLELSDDLVLGLSADGLNTDIYAHSIAPWRDRVTIDTQHVQDRTAPAYQAMKGNARNMLRVQREELARLIRAHQPDHIISASGEGLAIAMGMKLRPMRLPRKVELHVGQVVSNYAYPAANLVGRLRKSITRRAIVRANPTGLYPISHDALRRMHRFGPWWREHCQLMPDPTPGNIPPRTTQQARQALNLPTDGRYIGTAGVIYERKGVEHLLAAFSQLVQSEALHTNDRLLLAGRIRDDFLQVVENRWPGILKHPQIICINRFLTDDEFDLALQAMDVVTTPYVGHLGPASVLIRAAAAGRKVIANDLGWMGLIADEFPVGWKVDVTDTPRFAEAILHAHDHEIPEGDSPRAQQKLHDLLEFMSVENFQRFWCAPIRRRLGLPPDPAYRTWDDVFASKAQSD